MIRRVVLPVSSKGGNAVELVDGLAFLAANFAPIRLSCWAVKARVVRQRISPLRLLLSNESPTQLQ